MSTWLHPRRVAQIHRWLGLVFSVTIFMSAGSGILHTIMSRTQAPPPRPRAEGSLDVSRFRVPLIDAVAQIPGTPDRIETINLRRVGDESWYQIDVLGRDVPVYVNAETGALGEGVDEAYASQIAEDYLGETTMTRTDYLTEFDAEYITIFRILPVHRFDLDDGQGTRVYVSTATGSVTRHTDDRRQLEAMSFSLLHKWMFVRNKDLRDGLLVAVTSGILLVSLFGIGLFGLTRPKRNARRSIAARPGESSGLTTS